MHIQAVVGVKVEDCLREVLEGVSAFLDLV